MTESNMDNQERPTLFSAEQLVSAMEQRRAALKRQLQAAETQRAVVRDQIAQLGAREEALGREILALSGEVKETAFWLGSVRASMNPQQAPAQFPRPVETGERQDGGREKEGSNEG